MAILNIQTAPPTGQAAVTASVQSTQSSLPSLIYILTTDTFATVTTTGYLTQQKSQGFTFSNEQMALVYTTDQGPLWLRVVITYSGSTVLNTVVSLVDPSNAGDVVLPTIANYIAHFTNTTGTIGSAAANVINAGNIQAGLSGTAGTLTSFPGTAANGSLILSALNAGGAFNTTIRNSVMGQSSVISIPDPGAATANFLISATAGGQSISGGLTVSTGNFAVSAGTITSSGAISSTAGNITSGSSGDAGTFISFPATAANGTLILAAANAGGAFNTTISNGTMAQSSVYTIPDVTAATGQFVVKTAAFVSGNLIQASGTAGVTVDSGVATTNVQLKTQVKAATTGNIGGAGAGPITVTVAGLTAASVVVATIATSSNTVSVAKAVAGTGNFDVLFSGDPGATCTLNYVAYIVGQ